MQSLSLGQRGVRAVSVTDWAGVCSSSRMYDLGGGG